MREYCFECGETTDWAFLTKIGFFVKCRKCRTEEQWDADSIMAAQEIKQESSLRL